MEVDFCLEALSEALSTYDKPEIFNSDQGSQFTSIEFTQQLKEAHVKISMDGRGRCHVEGEYRSQNSGVRIN